jgi:hypothetical protein
VLLGALGLVSAASFSAARRLAVTHVGLSAYVSTATGFLSPLVSR